MLTTTKEMVKELDKDINVQQLYLGQIAEYLELEVSCDLQEEVKI